MENDVGERLRTEGLDPSGWGNGPNERYAAHQHAYDKVIAVERGSIHFGLPGSRETIALVAGDRLDLPAGTVHDAMIGSDGVECLEAHVAAGTLTGPVRHPSGTW
jgi:quercetin dioxygenase-like cupin family protein